jgi:hypothetical protein
MRLRLEATILQPLTHILTVLIDPWTTELWITDNEASHCQPLHNDLHEVADRILFVAIVVSDHATCNDASVVVEVIYGCFELFCSNV